MTSKGVPHVEFSNDMPIRVLNVEILVAGLAFAHRTFVPHHRNSAGFQVSVHAVGIVRVEGDVVQLAFAAIGFVEDLEVLPIVDLYEGDADSPAGFLGQREGLAIAEELLVKLARFVQIPYVDSHMRHAEDFRSLYRIRRRRGNSGKFGKHRHTHRYAGEEREGAPDGDRTVHDWISGTILGARAERRQVNSPSIGWGSPPAVFSLAGCESLYVKTRRYNQFQGVQGVPG
jgi:hypothetical protein